jgi:FAD dependent oxidoreductase TIGR03364
MIERFDDAVVGAGIVGLAHAYHLARRGRRVIVFERSACASGASVRNFGMIWPIGQPAGPRRSLALRSLDIWLEVLAAAELWHEQTGSLHVACREDEACVLQEFAAESHENGFACELLDPRAAVERSPWLLLENLRVALWSPSETCVDPRQVIAALPSWLCERHGVRFAFQNTVLGYDRPRVHTSAGDYEAARLWVCSGDDFQTLFPETFRGLGIVRCKLQMMRSEPLANGRRLGPMLAAGLTLRHYASFDQCPSLPALKARIAAETPEFDRFGIHVVASQNGRGEIVIGDSHEYGDRIEPFDKARIDDLVLGYLDTFLNVPGLRIGARWHGTYAKHPQDPYLVARPESGVTIVTCVGGAGMTLSFGLAEQTVRDSEELS